MKSYAARLVVEPCFALKRPVRVASSVQNPRRLFQPSACRLVKRCGVVCPSLVNGEWRYLFCGIL